MLLTVVDEIRQEYDLPVLGEYLDFGIINTKDFHVYSNESHP